MTSEATFTTCRSLARDIRRSPNWRAVRETVRPRGIAWTFRSRAPLPVLLYLAARDDRLLQDTNGGCALLELPRHSVRAATGRARTARLLDELWDVWLFGLPPTLLLVGSLPVVLLGGPTVALALVAAALTYIVLCLVLVIVNLVAALTTGRRRLIATAVGQLRAQHVTITLLHSPGGAEAARALVESARRRGPHSRSPVLILTSGTTGDLPTPRGRGGLRIDPLSPDHQVLVAHRPTDHPWEVTDRPGTFRGTGLALVLGGTALIIAVLAQFVAAEEASRCRDRCEGVPATYGDAIYWLLSHLLGGDPEGLGATSPGNRVIGLLVTVYGLFVLVAIIGRVIQERMDEDARSGRDVVATFESAVEQPDINQRRRVPRPRRPRPRVAGREG